MIFNFDVYLNYSVFWVFFGKFVILLIYFFVFEINYVIDLRVVVMNYYYDIG